MYEEEERNGQDGERKETISQALDISDERYEEITDMLSGVVDRSDNWSDMLLEIEKLPVTEREKIFLTMIMTRRIVEMEQTKSSVLQMLGSIPGIRYS